MHVSLDSYEETGLSFNPRFLLDEFIPYPHSQTLNPNPSTNVLLEIFIWHVSMAVNPSITLNPEP
jgi:hypothetical protein